MTIDAWLQSAIADAEQRGLPELKPMLETLARATRALRSADFNGDATDPRRVDPPKGVRHVPDHVPEGPPSRGVRREPDRLT